MKNNPTKFKQTEIGLIPEELESSETEG